MVKRSQAFNRCFPHLLTVNHCEPWAKEIAGDTSSTSLERKLAQKGETKHQGSAHVSLCLARIQTVQLQDVFYLFMSWLENVSLLLLASLNLHQDEQCILKAAFFSLRPLCIKNYIFLSN